MKPSASPGLRGQADLGPAAGTPATTPARARRLAIAPAVRLRTIALGWLVALALTVSGILDSSLRLDLVLLVAATVLLLLAAVTERGRTEARTEIARQAAVIEEERALRAVLEERARIARELHDVVAHHMSVIAIQAEAAQYRVEEPVAALTQSHARIRRNAVEALEELRRILGVLRTDEAQGADDTPSRAPLPTLARCDELVDNVRAAGLEVEMAVSGDVRALPAGVDLSAFRIIQESLSNALRHAPGSTVRIEVAHVADGVALRIANGPPVSRPSPPAGSGHGVVGMAARAAALGGTFASGSTADGGYEVRVHLPAQRRRTGR